MIATAGRLTCRELAGLLDDHLEASLGADEQVGSDAHLAACDACRAYLLTYAATIRLVRSTLRAPSDAPPSAPLDALVRDILDARPRLRLVRGGRPPWRPHLPCPSATDRARSRRG